MSDVLTLVKVRATIEKLLNSQKHRPAFKEIYPLIYKGTELEPTLNTRVANGLGEWALPALKKEGEGL